jgi:hypothetical protein
MTARILLGSAAILAIALARPAPASACTCSRPGVSVLPGPDVAAPTNTHVFVLFPEYEEWRDELGAKDADIAISIRARTSADAVAPKGKKGAKGKATASEGKTIEAARVDHVSAKLRIVELTPSAELKAKTRYQVVVSVSGGRQEVIGELVTGAGADTAAPTFEGVKQAGMQGDRGNNVCSSGVAYAQLVLGKAADESEAPVIYGLWTADGDGKVAYDQPAETYLVARDGKLLVGKPSLCSTANYSFPRLRKKVILGIRALDLAGNKAETAGEVVLDLEKVTPAQTIEGLER